MNNRQFWLACILSVFLTLLTGCSEGQSGGTGIDDGGDQYRNLEVHGRATVASQPMPDASIQIYVGGQYTGETQTDSQGHYQFALSVGNNNQDALLQLYASTPLSNSSSHLVVSSYVAGLQTLAEQAGTDDIVSEQDADHLLLSALTTAQALEVERLNQGQLLSSAQQLSNLSSQINERNVIESAVLIEITAQTAGQYLPPSQESSLVLLQNSETRQVISSTVQSEAPKLYLDTYDQVNNQVKQVIQPTVSAGNAQQVMANALVTLTGSAQSQNAGDSISQYQWKQLAGNLVTLSSPTQASTTFSAPNVNTTTVLSFSLTVMDTQGASNTAYVDVTVQPLPRSIAISASQNQLRPHQSVTLSAELFNFSAASYTWLAMVNNDYGIDFGPMNQSSLSFIAPSVGNGSSSTSTDYVVGLIVTDELNQSYQTDYTLQFIGNQYPVYTGALNWTTHDNQIVTLTASATDSDGTITSYQWLQTQGTQLAILNNSDQTAALQVQVPALSSATDYTFTVTITDNEGGSSEAQVQLSINQTSPIINAIPTQTVNIADNVFLDVSASDADGQIVSYTWQQIAGPSVQLDNTNSAHTRFTAPYSQSDTSLQFKISVTDNDGYVSQQIATIQVVGQNDSSFSFEYPTQVMANDVFVITTTPLDANLQVQSYTYSIAQGPTPYYQTTTNNVYDASAPAVLGNTLITFDIAINTTSQGTLNRQVAIRILPIEEPVYMPKRDNTNSNGEQSEDYQSSMMPSFSDDNSELRFYSSARNLAEPQDTYNSTDIFFKYLPTANVTRLDVPGQSFTNPAGTPVTNSSMSSDATNTLYSFAAANPYLMQDSRFVLNGLQNYTGSDLNDLSSDIFLYDRSTDTFQLLSMTVGHEQPNAASYQSSMDSSAHYVVYTSDADNIVGTDSNGTSDIFIYDRQQDSVNIISYLHSNFAYASNGLSDNPFINREGTLVAFNSTATDLTADLDDQLFSDIFIYDINTLTNSRFNLTVDGKVPNGDSTQPKLSKDGRYVAFLSQATNLVSQVTDGSAQLYVWDRSQNTVQLVSINNQGEAANAVIDSFDLALDGNYISYSTQATNLANSDTNGVADIFVHHIPAKKTFRVNQRSLAQQTNGNCQNPVFSPNYRWLAFDCDADNLTDNDTNQATDVFKLEIGIDAISYY